jgi:ribonuclease P protein component
MWPRQKRLSKDKEFDRIFKTGQGRGQASLAVKIVPNDLGFNRYGIIISNKISKKATERNRLKRIIREIVKREEEKLKLGLDMVIISRPGLSGKKRPEIESILLPLLKQLKMYK